MKTFINQNKIIYFETKESDVKSKSKSGPTVRGDMQYKIKLFFEEGIEKELAFPSEEERQKFLDSLEKSFVAID